MSYQSKPRKPFVVKQPYPRTRERNLLTLGPRFQQWKRNTTCSDPSWSTNSAEFPSTVGTKDVMYDWVVPGFKIRQARGEFLFNDLRKEFHQYEDRGGVGSQLATIANSCSSPVKKSERDNRGNLIPVCFQTGADPVTGLATMPISGLVTFGEIEDLRTEVSTRMLNDRGRSDSNLFESIAEAHQTLDLFNKPLAKLSSILDDATRASKAGKFRGYTTKGVSNLWLAYRYGIMPLVNDTKAIVEGLKKSTSLHLETTRAKQSVERTGFLTLVGAYGVSEITVRLDIEQAVTVRAMSLDEVEFSTLENIGFTGKGLLTLPWELVPYSFVADWYVNLGDFIGANAPAFGWKNKGMAMTTIDGILNTWTIVSSRATGSVYTQTSPASGSFFAQKLTRTRSIPYPPGVVIKSDFRFDKFSRSADAVSLFTQKAARIGSFAGILGKRLGQLMRAAPTV